MKDFQMKKIKNQRKKIK